MSTVSNRSNYIVSVTRQPQLTKTFPFSKLAAVKAYLQELKAQGHKAAVTQAEDCIQVRVRRKGHKEQFKTFGSFEDADRYVKRADAEQSVGLFQDYTRAMHVTTAQLIERYIKEECSKLRGGDTYATVFRAMLSDSRNELRQRIEQRKKEMKELGYIVTPLGAMRQPMAALEWLHKPLAQVLATDVEDFIRERLDQVAPSTVARQLDMLRSVYNVAINTWGYVVARHPLQGVRRPSFFNERDRRLKDGEEERLLQAAREEDRLRSIELCAQELMEGARQRAAKTNTVYQHKQVVKEAYEAARREALETYKHVSFYEAFLLFQLATAARRGETLGLCWDQVNKTKQTAFLPQTKNGRKRYLALRTDILACLEGLSHDSDLVFDVGVKELRNVWARICDAAGVEDLNIHDLRHEAISRAAESGLFPSVMDLQAYSGHRDLRSLSRYTHIMPTAVALKLDEAEALRQMKNGRERLKVSEMMRANEPVATETPLEAEPQGTEEPVTATNVVQWDFRSRTRSKQA